MIANETQPEFQLHNAVLASRDKDDGDTLILTTNR